jgi:uncharacterized protein YdbL (DUF1318 family)
MGELEPLSDEQLLAASVRAPSDNPEIGGLETSQAYAMAARRRQVFNRDEVDELKARGCLGEAKNATLAARDCNAGGEEAVRRDRLIAEENADREAILEWVATSDATFAGNGRGQLVDMYHRLLAERAKPGEWVEGAGGWAKK